MEFYVIKSGAFYLSRYPARGHVRPFGGELFDTMEAAQEALQALWRDATKPDIPVLGRAEIVRLTVTESRVGVMPPAPAPAPAIPSATGNQ